MTEFPIPTSNRSPAGIAAGPDAALGFTESSANKLGRIHDGTAPTPSRDFDPT